MVQRNFRRGMAVMLAAAVVVASNAAAAQGALDRFEKSHTSPSSNSRSSSNDSSDDSSDDDDDDDGGFDLSGLGSSSLGDDDDDSSDDGDFTGGDDEVDFSPLVAACMIPAFTILCIVPGHQLNVRPYGRGGHYIDVDEDDASEGAGSVDAGSVDSGEGVYGSRRWVEVELTGFMAMDETALLSHRLQATLWLGGVNFAANWEHFYERLDDGGVDHLNMYRFHYGFNLLGPLVEGLELYPRLGLLLLHGEEVTPAFDFGGEFRLYPAEPIAIYGSAIGSLFAEGPILLDARAQIGVTVERFEVRAGPRVLYQGEAEGFWGPAASVMGRF